MSLAVAAEDLIEFPGGFCARGFWPQHKNKNFRTTRQVQTVLPQDANIRLQYEVQVCSRLADLVTCSVTSGAERVALSKEYCHGSRERGYVSTNDPFLFRLATRALITQATGNDHMNEARS